MEILKINAGRGLGSDRTPIETIATRILGFSFEMKVLSYRWFNYEAYIWGKRAWGKSITFTFRK